MIDPSESSVEINRLQRINEELLGFMNPTPAQQTEIQRNCVTIAKLALRIHDYYKGRH